MSAATNPELVRAYQFIESDELERARSLLDAYLERERNNADAWWLYAHAVSDPMEAQDALRNVLRIDPSYPGAKALLAESEQLLTPVTTSSTPLPRLGSRPVPEDSESTPDFLDRLDLDDDEFDSIDDDEFETPDTEEDAPRLGLRRVLLVLAAVVLTLVIIGIGFVLTNPLRNRDTQLSATNIAGNATAVGTPTNDGAVTGLDPAGTSQINPDSTSEVVSGDFVDLTSALSAFILLDNGVEIEETSVGSTLIASLCTDASRGLIGTTLEALDTLARQPSIAEIGTEYVGVRVIDCEQGNLPLRTVVVSTSDALDFSQGGINASEFRARLQPIEN